MSPLERYEMLADEMRRAGVLHDGDRDRPITSWDARTWARRVEALRDDYGRVVEGRDCLRAALEDATQLNPGWRARAVRVLDALDASSTRRSGVRTCRSCQRELTKEHPALKLLADTLAATSGPARPEDIAKILVHALRATGHELVETEAVPVLSVWLVHEDSWDGYSGVVVAVSAERAIELAQADAPHAHGRWTAERANTAAEGVVEMRSR